MDPRKTREPVTGHPEAPPETSTRPTSPPGWNAVNEVLESILLAPPKEHTPRPPALQVTPPAPQPLTKTALAALAAAPPPSTKVSKSGIYTHP